MEENKEMIENISEEVVTDMLNNETVSNKNVLPVVILGVATLGVGFLIYKGVKYFKNKKDYIDVTPNDVINFSNIKEDSTVEDEE